MSKNSIEVCILGGGFGGLNTALYASSNPNLDITLVSKDKHHVYTPGLKYFFRNEDYDRYRFEIENLIAETEINYINDVVIDIDSDKKTVELGSSEIGYDKLVLALGSDVNTHGIDISDVERFYNWNDALKLRKKAFNSSEVVLVGGGYVGVELAFELNNIGLDVTVVDSSEKPLSNLSRKAGDKAIKQFNTKGIDFIGNKKVTSIDGNTITLDTGEKIDSQLIVWAGGIQASKIIQKIFNTDKKGIKVDKYLKTKYKDIYGVGDCINFSYKTGFNAFKQSKALANNLDPNNKRKKASEIKSLFVQFGKNGLMAFGETAIKNRLIGTYKKLEYQYYKTQIKK
ncbi:NADH dehydrogenase FAD-containing subunit [Methanonatronarchaeum thermophilum]|uniref:NADH dehydrogenase FAD-containing subunit n=1 Tax=Methanonatronarchaeum thermophilum TaxID=1927129 RepID=A0A1Y3GEN8_9EURY|nr:FAD-dependent oxidoreductase [Methanonatronarchaeum thermophilum]OUJ18654.1 NADH dehydrogenase FAD-containing subunit [Methanonatronarchaeum thermophilum]